MQPDCRLKPNETDEAAFERQTTREKPETSLSVSSRERSMNRNINILAELVSLGGAPRNPESCFLPRFPSLSFSA